MPPLEIDHEALGLTEEQLAAINDAHESNIEGLKNKNSELLGKIKQTKTESESELEKLREFKRQADISAETEKGNYEEALALREEKFNKELEALKQNNQDLQSKLEARVIDNGLNELLDGINVKPELKKGAIAMLRPQIELDGDQAKVGDAALNEYVKTWAEGEGKAFIAAPDNSGGDAGGGSNSPNVVNPWAADTRNLTKQAEIIKKDPNLAAQLKAAAGKA